MSYHTNHWQDHHRRDPQNGADAFNQPGVNATSAHGLALSKQAIIWVSIVVALVTIGLGIVFWLLCSCCWSGRRKTIARMVGDDRMFFSAWNPRGPKMDKWQAEQMKDEEGPVAIADRANTSESAVELRPLKKAAVRPVGSTLPHERMATPEVSSHGFEDIDVNAAHPGLPVVVERSKEPVYRPTTPKRGTRYYSQYNSSPTSDGNLWKRLSTRFSHIGRAY